jgi:undecaprenyl diphosphate synthase
MAQAALMGVEPIYLEVAAPAPVPQHVAIIMDGNGRWARGHGLPRGEGHRRGVEALRRAVRFAGRRGIRFLTLFSFSSENWSRPQAEIQGLLNLLRIFIRTDLADLRRNNVRVRVIGERRSLPADIRQLIDEAEGQNSAQRWPAIGRRLQLWRPRGDRARLLASSHGGSHAVKSRRMRSTMPPLRGAGDRGDSGSRPHPAHLWRAAHQQLPALAGSLFEFIFIPVLWPDFGDEHFEAAVGEFAARERRYGGVVGR